MNPLTRQPLNRGRVIRRKVRGLSVKKRSVCKNCIQSSFLKERISGEGRLGKCSYCSSLSNCVPLRKVANWVEEALKQKYREGELVPVFDDEDRVSHEQNGEDFVDILSFHFGADPTLFEDIQSLLTEPQEAEPPSFSRDRRYSEFDGYRDTAVREWEEIKHELRHRSRYFNDRVRSFFSNLFAEIESAEIGGFLWNEAIRLCKPSEGYAFYRARMVTRAEELDVILKNPAKELGPPPPLQASAGRMNFEGASVFYGAMDRETCIAELRPSLSSTIVSAKFKLHRELRILDLLDLDRSYHKHDLDIFHPDYFKRKVSRSFIRLFHREIRRPILPGREHEYLVTQVLSDYLCNAHSPTIDGMLFSSVQRDKGINAVLFGEGPMNDTSEPDRLTFVPGSIRVHSITGISYTASSRMAKEEFTDRQKKSDGTGYS